MWFFREPNRNLPRTRSSNRVPTCAFSTAMFFSQFFNSGIEERLDCS